MNGKAVAVSREKLEDTLVTWDSITTADGAVGKTSLIDAGLIGKNDFVTNQGDDWHPYIGLMVTIPAGATVGTIAITRVIRS